MERLRKAAENRALDEQRRHEAEQCRREEAEQLQDQHDNRRLCLLLRLATPSVLLPLGRVYPQRIIPWDDFPARQEEIWDSPSEPSFTP